MKKIILFIALLSIFTLTSCNNSVKENNTKAKKLDIKKIEDIKDINYFAREVEKLKIFSKPRVSCEKIIYKRYKAIRGCTISNDYNIVEYIHIYQYDTNSKLYKNMEKEQMIENVEQEEKTKAIVKNGYAIIFENIDDNRKNQILKIFDTLN